MAMIITVFWDLTPCCLVDTNVLEEPAASIFKVNLKNGGCRFLRIASDYLPNYTASYILLIFLLVLCLDISNFRFPCFFKSEICNPFLADFPYIEKLKLGL
jgi:hypothetical protein